MSMFLCLLDIVLELVRCSLESSLDRLLLNCQEPPWHSAAGGGRGNENVLPGDDAVGQAGLSPSGSGARSASSANPLKHVGKEKSSLQRRVANLQCWSVFFTCFVSMLFS